MEPCAPDSTWAEIIAAIGTVLTSVITLYLVHRRILADRDSHAYREVREARETALVEKLERGLADAKPQPIAKP